MGEKQSLIALIKHIFIDIINQKRKSFLIIYISMLLLDILNYMILQSFAIGFSYFIISVVCNIVLVYFYLAIDDCIPVNKVLKAINENFFLTFKVATINLIILLMVFFPIIWFVSTANIDMRDPAYIFIILLLVLGGVLLLSITSLAIIHSIIEHNNITMSIYSGFNTSKTYFKLIFKAMMVFIMLAIPCASMSFVMNFLSIILQLSFITIAIDSINKRNVK
jgi:hypothetical protein